TTSGAGRPPPSSRRRRVPSAENPLAVERERHERSNEQHRQDRGRAAELELVEKEPHPKAVERVADDRDRGEAEPCRVGPLLPVAAEAPLAVHQIAGRNRHHVSEEIAELRVPAKHQRNEGIDSDAKRGDERAGYGEARELAEDGPAFWGKRRDHWSSVT